MKEIDDLIAAHLHDEASLEETRRLFDWVHESPENAKEFARATMLHAQLREQLAGELQASQSGAHAVFVHGSADTPPTPTSRRSRLSSRTLALIATLAAGLVLAVGIALRRSDDNDRGAKIVETITPFVTVGQTVDVVWNGSGAYQSGDRTAESLFDLQSGLVRLHFDSGVDVTLQGPAKYELLGADETRLETGLLTATVPPGAEGFTVNTEAAQVVDLGTSFGIDLRNNELDVSVFDGEVEVAISDATQKRLLTEGMSLRIDSDKQVQEIELDPEPFEKLWPIASGIAGSSDVFRFIPPWPKRIRFVRSDEKIFVATEGYSVDLPEPLRVNISEPGRYETVEELTPAEIPRGARVRSYILHYAPSEELPPRRARRVSGSITFERPVRGLIVRHEELLASMGRFTPRRVGEAHERRQLSLTQSPHGDRIELSEDRRTVTVDLISPGPGSDLVRVIVDETNDPVPSESNANR